MSHVSRGRLSHARGVLFCGLALLFGANTAFSDALPQQTLVASLERWIDENTDLPPADRPARIQLGSSEDDLTGDAARLIGNRVRGLYDPDTGVITLMRPWDANNPVDVSVLLHELIHHRQSRRHYYCPAAREYPAYKLQARWLAERNLTLDVNWIGVVLASSCAPRDIHPDPVAPAADH